MLKTGFIIIYEITISFKMIYKSIIEVLDHGKHTTSNKFN